MNTNTAKRLLIAVIMAAAAIGLGETAYALKAPHDGSHGVTACNQCHKTGATGWKSRTSFENLCFNTTGCHKPGGLARKKQFSRLDASDRFRNLSVLQKGLSGKKHSSHGWKIPNTNIDAGVPNSIHFTEGVAGFAAKKIYCTRCHRAMGDSRGPYARFLRADPAGNYICMQCHSARRIDNVREPLESSALHYSHPVEVNYSTARGKKPAFFYATPQPASVFGYKTSASVRLYTTHNTAAAPYPDSTRSSRLAGTNKGAVVCQSCHGPIHSADSNPYTFDNLSAWSSGVVNYSSSAGNLLRMYPIVGPRASNNLCLSCHNVQTHRGFFCGRCHTPHKKKDEANRYLILENISTPYNGKRPVQFISTSDMAQRYGGYSTPESRFTRPASNKICQVCHTGRDKAIRYHRNYSAPNISRAHNFIGSGNKPYKFCPGCHMHTSGFTPSGCAGCHKFPPDDIAGAQQSFKHGKHTNDSVEGSGSGATFWKTGTLTDDRTASSYGFSCGRCHSPWSPYTATDNNAETGFKGKNHYGLEPPSTLKTFTSDIGFRMWGPLPRNDTNAGYTYGGANRGVDDGAQSSDTFQWWGAGDTATCRNIYCHGQFYNGYTSNNPDAKGSTNPQTCGKCHGARASDPPGKTGGVNYGAHPRHVGNANNEQYGFSATPNFRCNACHNLTIGANVTSIENRVYHVSGRVEIAFDQNSNYPGDGNSNYNGFTYGNYTGRKPAMSQRPAYKTCGLIYCHSDGSRTQGNYSVPFNAGIGTGTGKYPNWSSSSTPGGTFTTFGGTNTKRRCYRCHGNSTYKGITAAMPGYTSLRSGPEGKGNSHKKHVIENKFRCNICHSATINSANNAIANTLNHVNRFYNISIISTYRDNGIGNNYDNINKNCSSIRCHAGKTTPKWGNKIRCQDCHLSSTGDIDKRISSNKIFQGFSEAAARIYSTQWAERGHGKTAGTYESGNPAAARTCTDCHRAQVSHGTPSNPFRLLTAPNRPNMVCERCHGVGATVSGVTKKEIQTHASSVVATGKFNFAIKCIDCHDPHGDNNLMFMVHSTVARPRITGTRAESSNPYGQLLSNITGRNVDFTANTYTSDYAKKVERPKICQVCHTRTVDRDTNSPTYLRGRFRWYSGSDKAHGVAKCTTCHSHTAGFKGAGCDGCHGFPPTGRFNVLSGLGRTLLSLDNRQRPSGNPSDVTSEAATAGAHQKHYANFSSEYKVQPKSLATICSFCHQGGMYATGARDFNIQIGFKPFPDYTGSTQKYTGQSAVRSGYYGYSGIGITTGDTMSCTVKCHGGDNWLSNNLGNYSSPRWNVSSSVRCGKCHGAKKAQGQGSWPTSNRHAKHAGTGSGNYDFMCRLCHADTVMGTATTLNKTNHVNGQATFKFYTGNFTGNRVYPQSKYTSGDTKVNSGFGWCKNLYCHSRGTKTALPYTNRTAFPNYTAEWSKTAESKTGAGKGCSFCHGNKVYAGITSAMPNYTSSAYGGPKVNSHRKHVVENGLRCSYCHSATINSANNGIANTDNHVNKFINVTIIGSFKTGQTMYSSSLSSTNKTCKNVRCHAGKKTPNWGNKIICQNCHMASTGAPAAEDSFTWNNFSGTAARIYSTEWTKRGHGKPRSSGDYAFSNNSGAGKTCTNCHKPAVKHGTANNYFRLWTSNPDRLCLNCHGKVSDGLGSMAANMGPVSNITGIQSHTWANISTAGYKGGKIKAADRGGWNFGTHDSTDKKKVKCVDCHDPHGDKNNYMIHTYPNYSGSDRFGRPAYNNVLYNSTSNVKQMTFSTVGGPQMNWSSYVKPIGGTQGLGICQRCHSEMFSQSTAIMDNFNKSKYSNHNRTNRCTKCHKHKEGFKPSGCDGCHGYPPPPGPSSPNQWRENAATPSTVGLHTPHANNPRNRPGINSENDVAVGADSGPGFYCKKCHYNSSDGRSPDMGENPTKYNANMQQLTSVYGDWSPFKNGTTSVVDDTCSNIKCHTPRYYTRQWTKPTGCDSCHGYRNKDSLAFKVQTTNSHKIHVSYTTAGYDKKKYGLACSNCHYDWQGLNNYSTHYSSYVNITANGPVNTIANMKIKEGLFYTKGRLFRGFTTGNESFGTCAKAYCHGNFTNGTTATLPNWKKGVSPVTCGSCHKAKTAKVTGWTNGTTMPEAHPKHVRTAQYNFPCARCHNWTVTNNTTIQFAYSSHVNGEKNVIFNTDLNNQGGNFNFATARKCKNIYCHSSGYRSSPAGSFTTRTTLGRYTASWNDYGANRNTKTGNRPCSYCHGNNIYAGVTAAMPNQTSLWGNSHRTHVIRNSFRCVNCHAATVNAAGQIATYGNHVNGFKNISIISTYKTGQTLYSTNATASKTMTCKNVRCHAGKTTPRWGTYATCKSCHLSTAGDMDKRMSVSNIFQYYTAKTNPTAPRIYSTAWANAGHGRQTVYSSGNLAANKTCTNCHKAAVAHGTAGNPFRLYTINSVTGNPNTLCNDCHGTAPGNGGAAQGTRALSILPHASSVTATGRHNFAMKCVDCHDPHGDNNRFMLHSTLARYIPTTGKKEVSNTYGQRLSNITVANVDFTQSLYSSDYAKKVKAPKVCQVCHRRTYDPISAAGANPYYKKSRFRWYSARDKAHGVAKCTNCHSHNSGFRGAACDSCHGFPPTSLNTLIGRPGTNQERTMSGSTTAGAHQKHVNVFGSSNAICNRCHSGGMASDSKENDDITLKFDAFNRYTGVNQKYQGQNTVRTGFYGYSGVGAGTSSSNLTCSSMKCHGAKGNWLTKSFGTPSSPVWNSSASVFCGSCHGAKKAAGIGSYPTTNAHRKHAGWAAGEYDFKCQLCHSATITDLYTTLNDNSHVNAESQVSLGAGDARVDVNSTYDGDLAVNAGFGKCWNTYCHSKGTNKVAPYNVQADLMNFTATWSQTRGSYKNPKGTPAKCNYCHGNRNYAGVTSAMPEYAEPKANKHPKHVRTYNFLCANCHVGTTRNNTSIDGTDGLSNHVNRKYNVKFGDQSYNTRGINNSMGSYTSTNSSCKGIYCHSRGTKLGSAPYTNTTALANYTAHWGDSRGGYSQPKANMAKCNYCHGSRNTYSGVTSAMPNYASGAPKANRHPMHVATYGFTCTVCHDLVTNNSTSIDAATGSDLHVNQTYNVNFNQTVPGRFANNTGSYTYQASIGGGIGSKCRNTYCHSRGTDKVSPYNTRTSFANWTARWGDTRGGYRPAAIGQKAKCNYCHGNRAFGGVTAAMPNYSSEKAKANRHPIHVRTYGFTCTVCHKKVTTNSTSIDAAGGTGLHVNQAYNVNFNKNVPGRPFINNTGDFNSTGSFCRNTYCHSRGTKTSPPYTNMTALANYTANWTVTASARTTNRPCSFCHGNKAWQGITAAMPNYTSGWGNSHRTHVIGNRFRCVNCHAATVNAAGAIVSNANHVNGFKNISIIAAYKQGQTLYSTNATASKTMTCKNVRCHAGKTTPRWGTYATCKSCHLSAAGDTDKRIKARSRYTAFTSAAPRIYSAQWAGRGHGRTAALGTYLVSGNPAAGRTCTDCHGSGETRAGGLSTTHNTPNNPFRLITAPDRPNMVCNRCHGVGGSGATNTGIQTHASSVTATGRHNFAIKCIDCHDPHGDNNIFMLHSTLPAPNANDRRSVGSGVYGIRTGISIERNVDFVNDQYSSDYAKKVKADKVCQACHRRTYDPSAADPKPRRFRYYSSSDLAHGEGPCPGCHSHAGGFAAGESKGNTSCDKCHGSIYNRMRSTNSYHHTMMNTSAVYRGVTQFGPNDLFNKSRRCLQCHADHDEFSPLNNPGRGRRAANLRINARFLAQSTNSGTFANPSSFINTDFWPAKRNNVKGRTGSDSTTGNYSSTFPVKGPAQFFGVCISCHKNIQYKNTTQARDAIKTSRARPFSVALYTSSSHNFQIISGLVVFGSDGRSSFRANCTKCHNTRDEYIDKPGAQTGKWKWALHDRNFPSLLMGTVTSSSKPKIERLCFNCHDSAPRSSGGPGSMDYYSSIRMNSGAKMIKTALIGKTYVKPIESEAMAGRHKIDEFYNVTGTVFENSNPPASKFWNFSTTRHIECVDCHNTHGGNATIRRTPGGPYRGTENTSWATVQNFPDGNLIAGAQKGAWGVGLSYTLNNVTKRGQTPQFTKKLQVDRQYELCLKCHSAFAYGANPRGVPSGLPNRSTTGPFVGLESFVKQSDISKMINPNNFGYHPIFQKGRNQPPDNANALWPAARSNWMYKNRFTNKTAFISVSGLSYNFVPPFSQHSLLACTDCHTADNSGQALAKHIWWKDITVTNWTDAAKVLNIDDAFAYSAVASLSPLEVGVRYNEAAPFNPPVTVYAVAYGCSTDPNAADRSTSTLGIYSAAVNIGGSITAATPYCTAPTSVRIEATTTAATGRLWAALNRSKAVRYTPDSTHDDQIYIDYLGMEVLYNTTADVRGPHGSMQRWILTDADLDIQFDADLNGSMGDAGDKPNSDIAGVYEKSVLCYNCHRRDVYGATGGTQGGALYDYARIDHVPEDQAAVMNATRGNVWGIHCMNCHAGGGIGEIHGSFANSTTKFIGTTATRYNLTRPRGVRLMNGAMMNFNPTAGQCYTIPGNNGQATFTSGCSNQHPTGVDNATTLAPRYTYTDW